MQLAHKSRHFKWAQVGVLYFQVIEKRNVMIRHENE